MAAFAEEMKKYAASGKNAAHRAKHETLMNRRKLVTAEVEVLLRGFVEEAGRAFLAGEKAHASGQFKEARRQLRRSRNLAFEDTITRRNAIGKLEIVDEYFVIFAGISNNMKKAVEERKFQQAFRIGIAGLHELLDSDLSQELAFPVRVTSTPPGAEVWVGDANTGTRTPCEITYTPFHEKPVLTLRLPGRRTQHHHLPTYTQIRRGSAPAADWKPILDSTLEPGFRWRSDANESAGSLSSLWAMGAVPVVAGKGGHRLYSVDVEDGVLTPGTKLAPGVDAIRFGGRLPDGTQWSVHGQRTLRVRPRTAPPWEAVSVGRIAYPPITLSGLIVFVDEIGMAYAHNARDGQQRWRMEIGGAPAQQAYASKLGILLTTISGRVWAVEPEMGKFRALVPTSKGTAYALPLGDGALVIGGGSDGYRTVSADGSVTTMGDASPRFDRRPYVAPEGVAWIETDGRVRFVGSLEEAPADVAGLGRDARKLGGGGGSLFATTTTGTLRAISLTTPDRAAYEVPLGSKNTSTPIRIGRAVYLLVDGQLLAVEI